MPGQSRGIFERIRQNDSLLFVIVSAGEQFHPGEYLIETAHINGTCCINL